MPFFQRVTYEFVLHCETPIAHHQEVFGNAAQVFRKRVRRTDGTFAEVPYITADTMRHGLREAAAYTMLDAAGMLDATGTLSESALRLLFSGGLITGGGAGAVKLDEYREMTALFPALGLLGGCAQNRAIPGKTFVEDATLVCEESLSMLPEWIAGVVGEVSGARAHVEETTRVRMDPTLNPGLRKLLSDGEHHKTNQRLLASEAASESGDAVEKRDSKSSMMPRSHEVIVAGSLLFWRVTMTFQSDLERECGQAMIAGFLSSATVGGKRGTGCGRIRVLRIRDSDGVDHVAGREVKHFSASKAAEVATAALVAPDRGASGLMAHYRDNAARIGEMLANVVA